LNNNRLEQLDSLRGLASLSVFAHHMWMITPVLPLVFSYSPLRIFVYGHAAVILFFILSGFVLSLPFLSNKQGSYYGYILKRFCRIYIPYIISLAIAITLSVSLHRGGINTLSDWFNQFWNKGLDIDIIKEHIALITNIHTDAYNTVVWSLIHEMRISIVFPIIMLAIIRYKWSTNLLLCLLLSSIGAMNDLFDFEVRNGHYTSIFDTVHYTSFFIIGALLAKYKENLARAYHKLNRLHKWALLITAMICYSYSRIVEVVIHLPFNHIITEYGIAFGSIIVVTMALSSNTFTSFLMRRPIIFIGKISYSLYLYHFVILLSLINLFYGEMPIWSIFVLAFIITIFVSVLGYYFVEIPSAKLGRKISQKINLYQLKSRASVKKGA
jgi:peptidoglycan/LPS O-acetylase OafA/YrhL